MKRMLLVLALSAAARAVPVVSNGGFETGDFSGWQLSNPGAASVVANQAGDGFSGLFHGLLRLTSNDLSQVSTAAALDTFLNLPTGCLEDDNVVFGVAIRQTVLIQDTQDLTMLYHFLSNIVPVQSLNTNVYVTLGNGIDGENFFLTFPGSDSTVLASPNPRSGFTRSFNDIGETEMYGPLGLGDNGIFTLGVALTFVNAQGIVDPLDVPNSALAFDDILIAPEPGAPEIGGWQGLPLVLLTWLLLCERRRGARPLH